MHQQCVDCSDGRGCSEHEKAKSIAAYLTLAPECRHSMPVLLKTFNYFIIIGIDPVPTDEIPNLRIPNAFEVKDDWSVSPVYTQLWLSDANPKDVVIHKDFPF